MARLPASEKEWQKEMDANTLAEAEQIKSSPSRLKGAKQAAKRIVKEANSRAKAMQKVASPTPRKKGGPIINSNTNTPLKNAKRK